jgi:hypothetical protein
MTEAVIRRLRRLQGLGIVTPAHCIRAERYVERYPDLFSTVCHGVNATNSVVFDTDASGKIDRNTTVVVPQRGRCRVRTLVASVGPPANRNADVEPQPQSQ